MPNINLHHRDCMAAMAEMEDNQFDLLISDPPYGIGFDGQKVSTSKHGGRKSHDFKGWDKYPPQITNTSKKLLESVKTK